MIRIRANDLREAVPLAVQAASHASLDAKLVRIEGMNGVGKSPLARFLKQPLGAEVPHADDFYSRSETHDYAAAVVKAGFRQAVEHALANECWVVAEGVLLADALPETQRLSGFKVYIRRLTHYPTSGWVWPYAYDVDDLGFTPTGKLDQWVLTYHRAHRPHERADLMIDLPEPGRSFPSGPAAPSIDP